MSKKRIRYSIIFSIIFIIEVLIAIFLKNGFIRENVGDILVVPCIYSLLRILVPQKIRILHLYVLLFSILVEFLQLLNITTILANNNKILRIVLGGTFDIKDIISYTIGYLLILLVRWILKNYRRNLDESKTVFK